MKQQYQERVRNVRRPGKRPYSYAMPIGSRCLCAECSLDARRRSPEPGAIEHELRL